MYVSCLVLAGRCLSAQQRGRCILQLLWSSCCSRVTCHTSFGLYVCFWVVLIGVDSGWCRWFWVVLVGVDSRVSYG